MEESEKKNKKTERVGGEGRRRSNEGIGGKERNKEMEKKNRKRMGNRWKEGINS